MKLEFATKTTIFFFIILLNGEFIFQSQEKIQGFTTTDPLL